MNDDITKTAGVEEDSSPTGQENVDTPKTYTQAEVEALLQSEADKRVSAALKKQERKNQERIKEAEKLAKMNETEKFQYELEQREKAIAEKEKALALAENKNAASKILADKGIDLALVDFVVADDAETMKANISLLDRAFKESVKKEVEKRLSSNSPKINLPTNENITREQAKKMGIMERQRLLDNNPSLYKELFES